MQTIGQLSNGNWIIEVRQDEYTLIHQALEVGLEVDLEVVFGNIGRRIRAYRERHGITQAQFARASGISFTYISKLENFRRMSLGLRTYQRIIEAMREVGA